MTQHEKRIKENLIKLLPDSLSLPLIKSGVESVIMAHEGKLVFIDCCKNEQPASKEIIKEVRKLSNHERKQITNALGRYYSTRNPERLKMLEKDIEFLEQRHYDRFAWRINRDWEKERIRN